MDGVSSLSSGDRQAETGGHVRTAGEGSECVCEGHASGLRKKLEGAPCHHCGHGGAFEAR